MEFRLSSFFLGSTRGAKENRKLPYNLLQLSLSCTSAAHCDMELAKRATSTRLDFVNAREIAAYTIVSWNGIRHTSEI